MAVTLAHLVFGLVKVDVIEIVIQGVVVLAGVVDSVAFVNFVFFFELLKLLHNLSCIHGHHLGDLIHLFLGHPPIDLHLNLPLEE